MTPSSAHVARIMAVMEEAFDPAYGEAWSRRQITDALAMPSTNGLVVDASGEPIPDNSPRNGTLESAGFVLTRKAADEEELLLIAVSPQFRRRGLGESLLHSLFERAQEVGTTRIFLEMRRGNPAIHLYEKVGFKPIGQRPNYYRLASGERVDAITFGRDV
ncbi:GNAT family N-acetyltransferase [uncultured Erythrobacter sp.]|uniref:GNAT family N-acetyltransferase n=1 Tax=uncultured Erythrobacter sp. TaxID=263913 RepID=UPI00261826E0|nr:GNAT family N-acetyltransferase [uncultured Erythrobacter sp.]